MILFIMLFIELKSKPNISSNSLRVPCSVNSSLIPINLKFLFIEFNEKYSKI